MKIFIELFPSIFYNKHYIKKKKKIHEGLVTFQAWVSNPVLMKYWELGSRG